MKINCTKALLDFLGIAPVENRTETDPMFSYSANLLVINRKKCIAVVNDATGCGFILYGVNAKDKKNIQHLLEDGLDNMLMSENYSDSVIEKYLSDCSFPVDFCKNTDRSAIARMNKFCERVKFYTHCYDPDNMYQTMLLPMINDDIKYVTVNGKKEAMFTYEEQERLFREKYGKLYNCRAGVFDVTLKLDTPCVRRITVPLDFSLYYMHDIIQKLFLWQDYHLHDFVLKIDKKGNVKQKAVLMSQYDDGDFRPDSVEVLDEEEVLLSDVFPKTDRIYYEYDFGDDWIHEIRLIKIIEDADIASPVCTGVIGDAPPKDCGGPDGFYELQRILNDPKDERYAETVEWYRGTNIFQKNEKWINSDLRRRYLAGAWHLYYRFTYSDE